MLKRVILFCMIFVFIFCLTFVNFVSAGVSDVGVEYDSELISQFLLNEWVHVTIDIKDTSNIVIPHRTSLDFESKVNERSAIMINITNEVLSILSEDEFRLKTNSEFGGFFSGNITKEGFDKLLRDERVRKIYAKKYFVLNEALSSGCFYGIVIFVLLLITLIVLPIKLKKRRWKLKK